MWRPLSQCIFSLLICTNVATALKFTIPAMNVTGLDLVNGKTTISWEREATDPATGRLLLARTDVSPPQVIVLTGSVDLAKEEYRPRRELALSVEAGGKYRFEIWEPGASGPLATSFEFAVEAEGGSSSTMSSTMTSTLSATRSQTSTSTGSVQSQTLGPSQGTGSTSDGFAVGVLAGIGYSVPVGAVVFAVVNVLFF